MASTLLDPKNFKHVKSDSKTTTLQHKDGHILTIAHNALSKETKAQLDALSKVSKEDETIPQSQEKSQFASGGPVQTMQPDDGSLGDQTKNNLQNYVADYKSDPTLSNMVQGMGMGGVQSVEQGAAREAAPIAEQAGKSIIDEGSQAWNALKGSMAGANPNASSATPEAIALQKQAVANAPDMNTLRKAQAILNRMQGFSDGGQVKSQYQQDESSPDIHRQQPKTDSKPEDIDKEKQTFSNGLQNIKNELFGHAEGGEVKPVRHYDDGGKVAPAAPEASQDDPGVAHHLGELVGKYGIAPIVNAVKGLKDLGGEALEQSGKLTQGVEAGLGVPNALAPPQETPEQPAAAAGTPPAVQPASTPESTQQASPPASPDPLDQSMTQYGDLMGQGFENRQAGIQQQAQAQGQQAANVSHTLQQGQEAELNAKNAFQSHYNELEAERQAHMQDVNNGLIDPNQYWTGDKNGNGGHSKVAAAIGMILGGFNPTSNPNGAVDLLKFQMEQNLNAQAQNLGSKQNLLNANLRQFGNLKDAADMTRLMQADVLKNQLEQASLKTAQPMAKAAALDAAGKLQMEYAPLQQQLAMRRAMVNLANNGTQNEGSFNHLLAYMRQTDPEKAKEMESRYVPGVGLSPTTPVPEGVKSQIIASKNVNDMFNKTLDFAKTPIPKNPADYLKYKNSAETLQQQLIGNIKQAQHDGVYKESEAEFLLKQIGDSPASMFRSVNTIPKIKELQQIKQMEYKNLLNTYNLPQKALPQTSSQPQPTLHKNGKYYIQQGNYMVPVK